jgi:hypothetical protein
MVQKDDSPNVARRSSSLSLWSPDLFTSRSSIFLNNSKNNLIQNNNNNNNNNNNDAALPIVVVMMGCLVFSSSLAISTWIQGKILGISTGSLRPIPSLVGMATVCTASLASHSVSSNMIQFFQDREECRNYFGRYNVNNPRQLSSKFGWESIQDHWIHHKNKIGM